MNAVSSICIHSVYYTVQCSQGAYRQCLRQDGVTLPSRVLLTCERACPSQLSGRLAIAQQRPPPWQRTSTPPLKTARTARTIWSMTTTTTTTQRPTTIITTTARHVRTVTRRASRTTSCWTDPSTSRSLPRCSLARSGQSPP